MHRIDLSSLFYKTAKIEDLDKYIEKADPQKNQGMDITLTGRAPVWLYLKMAHALHGSARRLYYESPVTGKVLIFDHDPF